MLRSVTPRRSTVAATRTTLKFALASCWRTDHAINNRQKTRFEKINLRVFTLIILTICDRMITSALPIPRYTHAHTIFTAVPAPGCKLAISVARQRDSRRQRSNTPGGSLPRRACRQPGRLVRGLFGGLGHAWRVRRTAVNVQASFL